MKTRYTKALTKRGYPVRLSREGKLVLTKGTPDFLRRQIKDNLATIIAELRAARRDYMLIDSKIIGERVVIVKDEQTHVPARFADLLQFTLAECKCLIDSACEPALLKNVCEVKRTILDARVQAFIDPRPDLEDDSLVWERLLATLDGDPLWGPLHGMRCAGARLERSASGFAILPGEIEPDQFRDWLREWFCPDGLDTASRSKTPLFAALRGLGW